MQITEFGQILPSIDSFTELGGITELGYITEFGQLYRVRVDFRATVLCFEYASYSLPS